MFRYELYLLVLMFNFKGVEMKKFTQAILILTLLFSSCSEDYLETAPTNQISDKVVFQTVEGAQTVIDGVLRDMRSHHGAANMHDQFGVKAVDLAVDLMGEDIAVERFHWFGADYRFENPENDYLVKTWEWLNLTSLGAVKELHFGMESSDVGDWGINTPTYFCMDNFTAAKLTSAVNVNEITQELNVFPNPVNDIFYVEVPVGARALILTDNTGRIFFSQQVDGGTRLQVEALRNLPSGLYFLKVTTGEGWLGRKILKR